MISRYRKCGLTYHREDFPNDQLRPPVGGSLVMGTTRKVGETRTQNVSGGHQSKECLYLVFDAPDHSIYHCRVILMRNRY